jgi:hypothetical protein
LFFPDGIIGQVPSLDVDLVPHELVVSANRYELSCRHRKGTGKQTGDACEADGIPARAGAGDPKHEGNIGNQSIARTKNGRSGGTALNISVATPASRARPKEPTKSRTKATCHGKPPV